MYDKVGNLVDDDQDYEFVYDAWGRLRKVYDQTPTLVAEYTYNGLGHRVGWHYDVDADSTVENTSDDPWFFFAYDDRWRIVATYHEDDDPDAAPEEKPKEVFVYHNAGGGGLDGAGGSSYIDSVILRERDANTDWDTASDGVLEERLYYCQNWRADVVVLMTVNGDVAEFVKYSAYGEPFLIPAGDVNSTGATDGQDVTDFGNVFNATYPYDVRCDFTFDGTIDSADYFNFGAHYSAGYNSGRGEVSRSDLANRKAYAGYENDGNLTRFYHVRFRVMDTLLGRWTRRDPLGYVDGANTYAYSGAPLNSLDPLGLVAIAVNCRIVIIWPRPPSTPGCPTCGSSGGPSDDIFTSVATVLAASRPPFTPPTTADCDSYCKDFPEGSLEREVCVLACLGNQHPFDITQDCEDICSGWGSLRDACLVGCAGPRHWGIECLNSYNTCVTDCRDRFIRCKERNKGRDRGFTAGAAGVAGGVVLIVCTGGWAIVIGGLAAAGGAIVGGDVADAVAEDCAGQARKCVSYCNCQLRRCEGVGPVIDSCLYDGSPPSFPGSGR